MPEDLIDDGGAFIEPANDGAAAAPAPEPEGGAASPPEVEGAAGIVAAEAELGAEGAEGAAPAYQANFKYKVHEQEREIPEKYRALIKTAEDEKELKELFELAQGFKEFAKPKHDQTEKAFEVMRNDYSGLSSQVDQIREAYTAGDFDSFFQQMNVNQQKILQWALQKFQYMELPPEQKAQIDAQTQQVRAFRATQSQNQQLSSQLQNQIAQARVAVLNSELADPEMKPLVAAFDQRMNQPGAFAREVQNRGQLVWIQSQGKVDLTPRQAIEQVIQLFGLKAAPAAAAAPGAARVAPAAAGGNKGKADTLPNPGAGKGGSPVGKKIKSIADIKKYTAEKYG